MWDDLQVNNLEGDGSGITEEYPEICLEGLRKTTKSVLIDNISGKRNLDQDGKVGLTWIHLVTDTNT
jgi:hypothetical protein